MHSRPSQAPPPFASKVHNSSEKGKQCSLPKAMIQTSGFVILQHGINYHKVS